MSADDDILGASQDWLHRLRYDLAKAIEGSPAFQGCKSAFDVLCRLLELRDEETLRRGIRNALSQYCSDLCFTDNGSSFRRSMTQRTWFLGHWQAIIVGFSGPNRRRSVAGRHILQQPG